MAKQNFSKKKQQLSLNELFDKLGKEDLANYILPTPKEVSYIHYEKIQQLQVVVSKTMSLESKLNDKTMDWWDREEFGYLKKSLNFYKPHNFPTDKSKRSVVITRAYNTFKYFRALNNKLVVRTKKCDDYKIEIVFNELGCDSEHSEKIENAISDAIKTCKDFGIQYKVNDLRYNRVKTTKPHLVFYNADIYLMFKLTIDNFYNYVKRIYVEHPDAKSRHDYSVI